MKALGIIKKVICVVLGVLFFAFALAMTVLLLNYNKYGVTQFGDTTMILINDNIASDNFKKGDLVLVKTTKLDDIKVSDELFVYTVNSNGSVKIDLGKVGEVYPDEKAIAFENGSTYGIDYVAGKEDKVYKNIGSYLSVIESKWGFLFIVLVPGFLIFLYELYSLIVEIKYNKVKD